MPSRRRACVPLLLALALAACPDPGRAPSRAAGPASFHGTGPARVILRTEIGEIEVEVDRVRAPVTAANFLRYVDAGRYDGGRFHRTVRSDNQPGSAVRIGVIQAGVRPDIQGEDFPAIPLERTSVTGLSHLDGTISMARDGPDTATSDFFICVGDQPPLDFGGGRNPDGQGFAAFGRVVRGMDVVGRIHAAAAKGQSLSPPVTILRGFRVPDRAVQGQGAGLGRAAPEEVDPRVSSPQPVLPDAR